MRIYPLDNPVRHDHWGGTEAIPALLGIPNAKRKNFSELRLGAHRNSPSHIVANDLHISLDAHVSSDPHGVLGYLPVGVPTGALPYMLKFISVERPLSLQAHPDRAKAVTGHTRETRAGIPPDAPERHYPDRNRKPEMVVALDRLELLLGFKPIDRIVADLEAVLPEGRLGFLGRLSRSRDRAELAVAFYALMNLNGSDKQDLLSGAHARLESAMERSADPGSRASFGWIRSLCAFFPDDIAALAPLFLNYVDLRKNECVYLPPGEIHTYLRGFALEASGNSDNEVRGGLTKKPKDFPELMAILNFNHDARGSVTPEDLGNGSFAYPLAAREFAVERLECAHGARFSRQRERGPEILAGVEGSCALASGGVGLDLSKGKSVFVDAAADDYEISGDGVVFRVAPGFGATS